MRTSRMESLGTDSAQKMERQVAMQRNGSDMRGVTSGLATTSGQNSVVFHPCLVPILGSGIYLMSQTHTDTNGAEAD